MKAREQDANGPDERSAPNLWLRRVLVGSIIACVAVTCVLAFLLGPTKQTFYTDADTINQSAEVAKIRDILWQPPIKLPSEINSGGDTYEPRLSADGMTLFFVRGKAGENADIHYCTRTSQGWTDPRPLGEVNTDYDELGPEPSADGRSLYFYSDRPGGLGGYDLWAVHRGLDGRSEFGEAINLGPSVNSEFNDYGPALAQGGKALYFASNRPQVDDSDQPDPNAWPGTIREDLYHRTYDLYAAPITEQGVGKAIATTELNTPYNEGAPAVSPSGDFLYFASDRPGGEGAYDLYRARVLSGQCEPPTNLGVTVNTPGNELDPGLTLGGFGLYFSSNRTLEELQSGKPNPYEIYHTTSREVFSRTETHQTSIDWAAIWAGIGPNLLLALLALLLLLLLLALVRKTKGGKLSLLARCLLASLAAHLLLMLLFNVWEVTATLARELAGRGPIQIALAAPGGTDEIVSQIRGEFTKVDLPESPVTTVERRPMPVETEIGSAIAALAVAPTNARPEDRFELDQRASDAEPMRMSDAPDLSPSLSEAAIKASLDVTLPAEEAAAHQTETTLSVTPALMSHRSTQRPAVSRAIQEHTEPASQASLAPESNARAELELRQESLATTVSPDDAAPAPTTAAATSVSVPSPVQRNSALPRFNALQLAVPNAAPKRDDDEPRVFVRGDAHGLRSAKLPTPRARLPQQGTDNASHQLSELEPVHTPSAAEESSLAKTNAAGAADVALASPSSPADAMTDVRVSGLPLAELHLPALEEPDRNPNDETVTRLGDALPSMSRRSLTGVVGPTDQWRPTSFDLAPAIDRTAMHGTDSLTDRSEPRAFARADARMANNAPKDANVRALSHTLLPPDLNEVTSTNPTDATPALHSLDLRIPAEVMPSDHPYAQRSRDQRANIVEEMGGGEETEEAVQLALKWLAAHQSPDGRWDGDGFDEGCGQCGGETDVEVDVALTGLSLLCFLAADHAHTKAGPYQDNVQRALQWLTRQQERDGDLRRLETMYSQGIATIALAEASGMTHDSRLADPVQRAVHFIEGARNRQTGIWRYDPGQPGDTSVLGWQVMALKSAATAGAQVSMEMPFAARRWLDRVSSPSSPGLYAYQPNRAPTPSMTAEGLFIQQVLGRRRDEPRMQQSVAYILDNLPDWDEEANTYYWYYATLALFHHQGEPWHEWNTALTGQLLPHQRKHGQPAGSWDPHGEWARVGGRVYQTALCTLMLEVYYRYLPLFLRDRPEEAIGTVEGRVTDASTGTPIANATVRLDLPGSSPVEVKTNVGGGYVLHPPEVPAFFALSASGEDFLPMSKNVASAMVQGTTLALDFELQPEDRSVVAIEAVPDVHHLGDDRFTGQINSQFQKQSEGSSFRAAFPLTPAQLPPNYNAAVLTMLVRGVQIGHFILVNGRQIDEELDSSPRDGSFGAFHTGLDPTLLQAGANTIEIIANALGGDIDDFEFVNMQIRLLP